MSSTLESYELIRFAEAFEARLATAGEMLAGRPGLEPEKRWLAEALELVRTSRAPSAGMLERMKDLPELEDPDSYYDHQLVGLAAVLPDGSPIGQVTGVRHEGTELLVLEEETL